MPAEELMTWVPSQKRWLKKYRSRMYGVSPKQLNCPSTKDASRSAANAWWRAKQAQLDDQAEADKPHREAYEIAIKGYRDIRQWCEQHGDVQGAAVAAAHLEDLQNRLSLDSPPPLLPNDNPAPRYRRFPFLVEHSAEPPASLPVPGDGRLTEAQAVVWADRLRNQQKQPGPVERTVGYQVGRWIEKQKTRAKANEISTDRYGAYRYAIKYFLKWAGEDKPVADINADLCEAYHNHLLDLIGQDKCSRRYAKARLDALKQLVRWLFDRDLIPMPKNVANDKALRIKLDKAKPESYPIPDIKTLLSDPATSERTKLYVLLALNTGAYPSDIADLQADEVDLKRGRITRKRSKTKDCPNVPTVSYKLWPKTLGLMKKYGQRDGVFLLNEDGKPLQSKYVDGDKAVKICNITSAYKRAAGRLSLTGCLAQLRKTSANLLFNNEQFKSLHTLFLGHSPRSVAEQFYVAPDTTSLDKAIDWLGAQYDIFEEPSASTTSPTPA